MTTYLPFGAGTYTLNSSISSTQTTITLTSFTEPVSDTPYTMVLIGSDIAYGTIQPRTSSSEFISFTGITQNADGTATLTGVTRGLSKKTPFTTSATFKLPHAGQSVFIISDAPQVFNKYSVIENAETITGVKTFATSATPKITDAPLTPTEAVNKAYADGLAIAGAPDASTIVKGIGRVSVAPVAPTIPIFVGQNDPVVPTQGENDALVGNNTDIAVGTGNKFVTQTGLQKNAEKYAADAGANDTYVITLSPVPTSYATGMVIHFKANTVNTGTATVNVNGLGAKTIVKGVSTTLDDGDIQAGQFVTIIYDGTNMVLQNPVSNNYAGVKLTQVAAPIAQVVNSTAESTMFTYSLLGGTLGTSNAVRINGLLSFSNSSGGAINYTVRLKYGATTLITTVISVANGVTNILRADALLFANASTSAQRMDVIYSGIAGATSTNFQGSGTATEVSTGALNLVMTVQMGTANANASIDFSNLVISRII